MILDNDTMFANALAYDGTPTVLDIGSVRPGPGEPFKIFIQGSSDLAGCTGFTVSDGAVTFASGSGTLVSTHVGALAGNLIEFELPSDIARFVDIELTGTVTAGSWSCGVSLPGNQTAS